MKQRYTSKELRERMKEDELETLLESSSAWVQRYRQHFFILVLLVVAGGAGYLIYGNYKKSNLEEAAGLYNRASLDLANQNWQEAASKFDTVARDFSGTGAALRAAAAAAQAYFYQGDYEKARQRFEQLSSHRDPVLSAEGLTGIGMVLEAEEKFVEAAEHYGKALESRADSPLRDFWRLRQGYCLEQAGRPEEARAAYESVDRKSSFRDEADRRLLWLATEPVIAQM